MDTTSNEAKETTASKIDFIILSDNYWPSIPQDTVRYHPAITDLLAEYHDTFAVLKKPRKLVPAQHLGKVDLELDFEDGSSRSFAVTPVQVSVMR